MFCNKCGNEIIDGSEFCSKCGTKLSQNKKQKVKKETSKSTRIIIIVLLSLLFIYFVIQLIFGIKLVFSNISKWTASRTNMFCFVFILAVLCGYGLVNNILKLIIKDKSYTAEQLQKRKKRKIITLGISTFIIVLLCITLNVLTDNLFKLQYNIKYVYEDTYITFFEDGTYERDVKEIIKSNYTFNKETKEIVCKEIQLVYGEEFDLEMHFDYLNENEIKKTSMKVLEKNFDGEYGQIFSTKNILKEKEEKTEKQENAKDTRMLHEEDNYEYIGFSSNGLQRMLLAFFEDGRLGIRTYSMNKYNGQYEQVGNIQWGTYQVKHNVIYAGNAMMTITSPDEVSKVQLFKYNGMEFTPIEVNNGNKNTNTNTQNSSSTNEQEYSPIDNMVQDNNTANSGNDYYDDTTDNPQEFQEEKNSRIEELTSQLNTLKKRREEIENEFIKKEKEFYANGGFENEDEGTNFREYEGDVRTELGYLDEEISKIQSKIEELE